MKEDRIRRLIDIFRESGVEEMEYRESFWRGMRLRLRRQTHGPLVPQAAAGSAAAATPPPTAAPSPAIPAPAPPEQADDGLHAVRAPMVGTFRRSPSPDAEPFVRPGDQVRAGQTLCIIEAMKIMNEIEADVDGEVVTIEAEEGGPVEYNQPLMHLRPS